MQSDIISVRRIDRLGSRLKAGSFLSEDQALSNALALWPGDREDVATVAEVFRGPIFRRVYVREPSYGRKYVSAADIDRSDYWGNRLIGNDDPGLLDQLALKEGMVIVTCSGMNLGWAMLVREDMHDVIGSHDLIRVVARNGEDTGYLAAFFASRLGWISVRQAISGGSVKHVEPADVNCISIPWPDAHTRERLGEAMLTAGTLRAESNKLISQATDRVFASIGMSDLEEGAWAARGRELGFGSVVSPYSLRAWSYSPRVQALRDEVGAHSYKPLEDWVVPGTLRKGPSFKRIQAQREHAIPLIGQRQLFRFRPRPKLIARSGVPERALVAPGTTLVASCGTFGEAEVFGRATIATQLTASWLYSNHILRVVPREQSDSGWLYAFLRSRTAFRMLRSLATGSKQQDLHPDGVRQLPVPRGSDRERREVQQIVLEALDKRDEAYEQETVTLEEIESLVRSAV